jgi:hypothetical protein
VTPESQFVVYPNPFNPGQAVRGTVKVLGMPTGATFSVYTVSGELVHSQTATGGPVEWDGRTLEDRPTATGTYYYLIRQGEANLATGHLVIWRVGQ